MEDWETKQTHEQQTKQLHIHQQHSHWKAQSRRPWATRDASISSFSTESDAAAVAGSDPNSTKQRVGASEHLSVVEEDPEGSSAHAGLSHGSSRWKGISYHHYHSVKEPTSYTLKEINLKKTLPFDKCLKKKKNKAKQTW